MLANERIVVTTMTTMGTMEHQKQTASSASSINPTPSSSSTFSSTSSLGSVKNHVGKAHDMIAQHDANCVPAKTNQSTQSTSHNSTQTNPVQVQNYIHWINTHLKKRPGVKLLENLQTDLCSGVALVHLIEVISGTFVADINLNPRTRQDCVENIEKILSFMQSRAIKMHQITSNEILDGNLKSIMRLVLALAAHFKPSNVQPYSAAMCHQMKQQQQQQQQQGLNPTSNRTYNKPGSSDQKYHEAPANTFNRPSSSLAATATSSSSIQNHKTSTAPSAAAAFGKRSQSSNNVHSNHHHLVSRQTVTFIPPPNYQNDVLLQNGATNPEPPPQHQGRNLDSMTHLVQAACVSISDVRRYKNENFNIKYVRRNNLQSSNNVCTNNGINNRVSSSSSNANYLNPINIQNPNSNQTYVKDVAGKEIESSNGKMMAGMGGGSPPSHPPPPPPQYPTSPPHHRQPFVETTLLMSPSQPIASSTVIQAPTFFRTPTSSPAHSSTKIVNTTPRRSISASKNMTYVVGEELKRQQQQQQQQQKEESEEQDKTATPIRLEMELHGANEVKIVNSQVVGSAKPNVEMTDNPINNANSNDKTRIINPTNSNTNTTTVEKDKPAEEKIIDLNLELVETDLEDVQKLKAMLMKLQSLIMNGNNNADDKEESLGMSNTLVRAEPINPVAKEDEEHSEKDDDWSSKSSSSIDEQLAMYRSKLQQLEIANTDLRRALDEERSNSNTAKTCACGLKIRVGEQEAAILEMRSANIEMQLSKEQLESEKSALAEQLSVATRHLMQCKYEMAQKDAMIERIGLELAELKKETEQMRIVKQQVKRVSDTLELVQEKENALNSMLSNTDRKLDLIDSKLNKTNTNKEQQIVGLLTTTTTSNGEAIELHDRLKENLGKLKLIANANNQPFEHSQLAQIERNLWSLVDKILNQHNNHEERSSSSSSSGSSSPLTSSSSCSPVLLNDALQQQQQDSATTTVSIESQPTAEQTSPSSLSTRSSSSSSTSLTAATTAQQTTTTVISDVNESNVKKIISRLLSQNYVTENKGQSQRGSKQSTSATALLTLSTASSSIVTNPNHTQCLYYLDKASNPNCVTIFKKIDEITLNDFKSIVKLKPGNYKFRFKSLDPEFGFLKEEISCDSKVLPKCEGKIVAWIETC